MLRHFDGLLLVISIHAPRTGSDDDYLGYIGYDCDFNPRSPHGERRQPWATSVMSTAFQSTLPARGATRATARRPGGQHNFNPRSPHGERQEYV